MAVGMRGNMKRSPHAGWEATLTLMGLLLTTAAAHATPGRRASVHGHGAGARGAAAAGRKGATGDPWLGVTRLQIDPGAAVLDGPRAQQHLVVTGTLKDGTVADV